MTLLSATNRQVPDHAILDFYNKQVYLGNQYSVSQTVTVSNSESTVLFLQNNTQTGNVQTMKSVFQSLLRVSENTASRTVLMNLYLNPTVAAFGIQTVAFTADTAGSLNNTYFYLNDASGNAYYVWFNINSAGTDPMVAGKIGVEVAGATNASAATLGTAAKALIIALNGGLSFGVTGTSTLTITNLVRGPFVFARDSAVVTGFTFAVTAGPGSPLTVVNLRVSYGNNSIATVSYNPTASANGTLVDTLSVASLSAGSTDLLRILDNNQSLLVTANASASSTSISTILQWYEI